MAAGHLVVSAKLRNVRPQLSAQGEEIAVPRCYRKSGALPPLTITASDRL